MCASYDPETKVWAGAQNPPPFNPRASIGDVLLYCMQRNSRKVAQINANDGVELTYQEIMTKSIRVAENLRRLGLKQEDVVAVISRNNSEIASVLFGTLILGLAVNTLDPSFQTDDLAHMLKITRPKLVFCEPHNLLYVNGAIAKIGSYFPKIVLIGAEADGCLPLTELLRPVANEDCYTPDIIPSSESKIALIVCSSGTTGMSKGVCLSHAQLIAYSRRAWSFYSHDISLAFSSLYWITGIVNLLAGTMEGATRVITEQTFTPELLLDIIEQYKLTAIFSPPSHLAQLLECPRYKSADLSSVERIYTGGSVVLEDLRQQVSDILPNGDVIVVYGLSEIGSTAAMNVPKLKPGSAGRPAPGAFLKIIDETGRHLGPEEKGEICLKFEYSFLGYKNDEEQTKAVKDTDGWLHTGDLGYFDKEHYLFIVGRSKEIIKYRGFQVSPTEIENFIQRKTGFFQACVVGVEDLKQGSDLVAAVILKGDGSTEFSEEDIIKLVENELPDYKHLRGGVYFVDRFPLTPSGKVKRNEVKAMVNQIYKEKSRKAACRQAAESALLIENL